MVLFVVVSPPLITFKLMIKIISDNYKHYILSFKLSCNIRDGSRIFQRGMIFVRGEGVTIHYLITKICDLLAQNEGNCPVQKG